MNNTDFDLREIWEEYARQFEIDKIEEEQRAALEAVFIDGFCAAMEVTSLRAVSLNLDAQKRRVEFYKDAAVKKCRVVS